MKYPVIKFDTYEIERVYIPVELLVLVQYVRVIELRTAQPAVGCHLQM